MTLKSRSTLAILTSALIFSTNVIAQGDYRIREADEYDSNRYAKGVTLYEDCYFQGKSQVLAPGEFRSLRDIGFGNDRVSSIRVHPDSEAVIFRDDDFRGPYARVDRDIRCFDTRWDNEASSIKVHKLAHRDNAHHDQAYDDRDREYEVRDERRDRGRRNHQSRDSQSNVTAKNVSQVIFDNISLQQVSSNQWSMDRARGASKPFQEIRRDRDSVYLENKYTAERVRIDLYANDVTVIQRNGRSQRYRIDRKKAALKSGSETRENAVQPSLPDTRIRANCFTFKAYTQGGRGGLRFGGKEGFHTFKNKPKSGRVCHKGPLRMEINKRSSTTQVTVEINGKRFLFAANEQEDRLLNNWYRKNVKLKVGR